ncbi:uncharacterized protein LOC134836057 isoform X2 [Culicoides brevitarsis]|uniref:uncharacterized protein LOC134836057 isoform X2 n=1 Tax=Culicoides brevitarsis TaxID=469753 RepID=UPI00307C98E2
MVKGQQSLCLILVLLLAANAYGYHSYKDALRAKFDDEDFMEMFSDDGISDRVYFYRTPMSAYADLAEPFGKRTVNKFKNLMINKDMMEGEGGVVDVQKEMSRSYFPRTTPKRGAILSWALPAANRFREMNINYRPTTSNRPAA